MSNENTHEPADVWRCAVDAGFGVCVACGTKLILSDGWTPSYNDPDNGGLAPMAEPFCPKCEAESLRQEHAAQLEERAAGARSLYRRVRSPYLTPAMARVLTNMREEEEELVGDRGQWWVGEHRTNWATARRLLRLCLVRTINVPTSMECFVINETGRAILDDPTYVPPILRPNTQDDTDARS